MEKEFIPYEQALALKKLGFDEPCFMKIWWLNGIDFDTKKSFKPYITINDKEITFKYHLPKKHPWSGFKSLDLQIPTFSQAFRFFREKYNIDVSPLKIKNGYTFVIIQDTKEKDACRVTGNTYEEAELACLRKLIDIVKENRNNMETEKVTRFEVIDHTSELKGRILVKYNVKVEISIQDDGKTMKVFLTDKINNNEKTIGNKYV